MSKIYLTADNHLGMKGDNPIWLKDCFDYYNNIQLRKNNLKLYL